MCFVILFYFMNEWYNYLILLCGIPAIALLVLCSFFLLESPHYYLFMRKDLKNFNDVIEYLMAYNNVEVYKIEEIKNMA